MARQIPEVEKKKNTNTNTNTKMSEQMKNTKNKIKKNHG